MGICCCFGARRRRQKGHRTEAIQAEGSGKVSGKPSERASCEVLTPLSKASFLSEYHDALEHFPSPEAPGSPEPRSGYHSPRHPSTAAPHPEGGPADSHQHHLHEWRQHHPATLCAADCSTLQPAAPSSAPSSEWPPLAPGPSWCGDQGGEVKTSSGLGTSPTGAKEASGRGHTLVGTSDTSEDTLMAGGHGTGPMAKLALCLPLLDNIANINLRLPTLPGSGSATAAGTAAAAGAGGTGSAAGPAAAPAAAQVQGALLRPGCTLKRRDMSQDAREVREAWDECDGASFLVRGPDYMRTKLKQPSRPALYRLLAADVLTGEDRHALQHAAARVDVGALLGAAGGVGCDPDLPRLLIFNIMLPIYQATLFGGGGARPSQSLIYYFGLPPDWDAGAVENQRAVALLRRMVANGREADGTPSRDRLKLIPRVVNVAEWAERGPLSPPEHKLLTSYNDKPILTRPQHNFFAGPGYLEVDIDIHAYQFLARKAFGAYINRLREVVFENAFVVQGNSPEELPEQVLACVRMYRIDLAHVRRVQDYLDPSPPPPQQQQEKQRGEQEQEVGQQGQGKQEAPAPVQRPVEQGVAQGPYHAGSVGKAAGGADEGATEGSPSGVVAVKVELPVGGEGARGGRAQGEEEGYSSDGSMASGVSQ